MQDYLEMRGSDMIIFVPEELDHHNAEKIRAGADLILEKQRINQVIFDFQDTVFMDSSGIGMIIGRYKTMIARGGCVSASGLRPPVDRLFHLAGLHRIIAIDKTEGWEIHE